MISAMKQRRERNAHDKGFLRGKVSRTIVSVVAATAMAMTMAVPAFAVSGQMRTPTIGQLENGVYQIPVDSTAFTAPSKFWGGIDMVPDDFAVSFNDTANGSSMAFDMADATVGAASYGPLYIDGSSSGTPGSYVGNITEDPTEAASVWSSDWVYAFRVCPSVTFGTSSNGSNQAGFNWKGCFATYFTDWDFSFNATSAFGSNMANKQITLTYYGGYIATQTSRGTSYGADLSSTTTDLSYGTTTAGDTVYTSDTPVGTSYTAQADGNGKVTFSGSEFIKYGGNYTITYSD